MTVDPLSDFRSALADLGPDELTVVRSCLLNMRDKYATGDRADRAFAAAFALCAGVAADAGRESAETLAGIAKATRRRTPTSH